MDNQEKPGEEDEFRPGKKDSLTLEERLKAYVQKMETDENMEELAKKLASEWSSEKPGPESGKGREASAVVIRTYIVLAVSRQ